MDAKTDDTSAGYVAAKTRARGRAFGLDHSEEHRADSLYLWAAHRRTRRLLEPDYSHRSSHPGIRAAMSIVHDPCLRQSASSHPRKSPLQTKRITARYQKQAFSHSQGQCQTTNRSVHPMSGI